MTENTDIHNGKYFFFYKSKLSNWHMKQFQVWGITYNCGEQAMMSAKAILFGDLDSNDKIMKCSDPRQIQSLGRGVKGFDQKIWRQNRDKVLYCISHARFSQIEYLKDMLLATDKKILVQASPVDFNWGIGLSLQNAKITPDTEWKGLNLLGLCFTDVKSDLLDGFYRYPEYNPFTMYNKYFKQQE